MSGKILPQQILDALGDHPEFMSSAEQHYAENIKDGLISEKSIHIIGNRLKLNEKMLKRKNGETDTLSIINNNEKLYGVNIKHEGKPGIPRYEPGVKLPSPVQKKEPAVRSVKNKHLKNWDADHWAIPAVFVRCGLFSIASVRNRPDKSNDGPITLEGLKYSIISHTGELLRFSYLKILLSILSHCAKNNSKRIKAVLRQIIKEAGIKPGGSSYIDAVEAIRQMQSIQITIVSGDHACKTPQKIITEFCCDENGVFDIEISDMVFDLLRGLSVDGIFSKNNYLVHINKEQHIAAGSGLAGWLHAFYSSHRNPYAFKIQSLIELSGGKFDPSNSKKNISAALQKLQDINFLKSWRIDSNGIIHVEKTAIDNKSISVN